MRTEVAVALLRRARLFAELDEETLAALADRSVERSFPRHARLFHQGDPGSGLYVLASGLVKVIVTSEDGEEMVLVTLGQGEAFGELSPGGPRPRVGWLTVGSVECPTAGPPPNGDHPGTYPPQLAVGRDRPTRRGTWGGNDRHAGGPRLRWSWRCSSPHAAAAGTATRATPPPSPPGAACSGRQRPTSASPTASTRPASTPPAASTSTHPCSGPWSATGMSGDPLGTSCNRTWPPSCRSRPTAA